MTRVYDSRRHTVRDLVHRQCLAHAGPRGLRAAKAAGRRARGFRGGARPLTEVGVEVEALSHGAGGDGGGGGSEGPLEEPGLPVGAGVGARAVGHPARQAEQRVTDLWGRTAGCGADELDKCRRRAR